MALEGALDASVSADAVSFSFTVTNGGDEPVSMQFMTGCKADFVVKTADAHDDGDGEEVWRFTDGRMFTQVISTEQLGPGQSETFRGVWDDPEPGEYTATGILKANNADCKAHTQFSV